MNTRRIAIVAGVAALSGAALQQQARADVTWEHHGSISVSSMPGVTANFSTFTSFTPRRERVLLNYSLPSMMPLPFPSSGSAALITRYDDDRMIGYSSTSQKYFDTSIKSALGKMMWNPFNGNAPELAKRPTPELTDAQRRRLGAEVRAVVSPVLKDYALSYFHKLDNVRTIQGIPGHGYRLTQLINVSGNVQHPQWLRASVEWWLGDIQQGDDVIYGFQQAGMDQLKMVGYPSTSMWMNEMRQVFLYSLPEPYIKALQTFTPGGTIFNPTFGGTPLALYATITMPKDDESGVSGDTVKFSMGLTKRFVSRLPESVFEAPADYQNFDVNPYLDKIAESRKEMSLPEIIKKIQAQHDASQPY